MSTTATTSIRIRPAVKDDLAACAAIDHSASTDYVWQMELDHSNGKLSTNFRTVRLPRSMRVLYPRGATALQNSWDLDACFLVAVSNRQVIGYVHMREQPAEKACWITDLAVDVAVRRQGIGSDLLEHARTWARERAIGRVIAETTTKNHPSVRFLEKNGLAFCGYNDFFYLNQDIAIFFAQNLRS